MTVGSPPGSFGSGFDTTVEYDFLWKPTSAPWVVDLLPDPAAAGVTFAVLAVTDTRFEIRTTGLGEGGRAVISWSISRGRVTGYALQSSTAAVEPASSGAAAAVLVGGFAGSALRSTAALLLGVQPVTSVALSQAATDDPIQLAFSGGSASGDTVEVPVASVAAGLADFSAWAEVPGRIVHDFGYSPEALQARVPVRPSAGLEAAIGAAGLTLLVTVYLPLFIPSSVWGCATPPTGSGVTRCYGMSAGVCVDRATDTPDLPIAAEYFAVEARANGLFDVVAYTDADCRVPRPQQLGLDVGNPEFAAVAGLWYSRPAARHPPHLSVCGSMSGLQSTPPRSRRSRQTYSSTASRPRSQQLCSPTKGRPRSCPILWVATATRYSSPPGSTLFFSQCCRRWWCSADLEPSAPRADAAPRAHQGRAV